MSSYVFPGYPIFLEAAAKELGRPEASDAARRISALSDLANLCAQATHADPAHVEAILARAGEFRDQLETAYWAAEKMLAEVKSGLAPARPPAEDPVEAEPTPDAPETGPAVEAEPTPDAAEPGPALGDPDLSGEPS